MLLVVFFLYTHLTDIGKLVYSDRVGTQAIPNNSQTTLFSFTGEVGATYLIFASVVYNSVASSGTRRVTIGKTNEVFAYEYPSNYITSGCVPITITDATNKVINVGTYQSSGSSVNISGAYLRIVRLS